jgi:hypothetical protein
MIYERDYILRQIQRMAVVIAHLTKLKESGEMHDALEVLRTAYGELFAPVGDIVSRAAATTAAELLVDPGRIAGLARLVAEEAELLRLTGDRDGAIAAERRALELGLEAYARDPEHVTDIAPFIRELARRVPTDRLDPPHRDLLGRVNGHPGRETHPD